MPAKRKFCEHFIDYPEDAHDRARSELYRELDRLGVDLNDCAPDECEYCGNKELEIRPGMVGEDTVFCPKCQRALWSNTAQAITAVF